MADISPSQQIYGEKEISFTFTPLFYRSSAGLGRVILDNTVKTLTPFVPATETTCLVPSRTDAESWRYKIKAYAVAWVSAIDVSGFTFLLPLNLINYGNVDPALGGTPQITIDGSLMPSTLSDKNIEIVQRNPISRIRIPNVSALYTTDLNNLQSSPIFTADPANVNWRSFLMLTIQVILSK